MSESPFLVTITPKEMYDVLQRLNGKVDILLEQQNRILKEVEDTKKDLDETRKEFKEEIVELKKDYEARLRRLESGRWPLPSIAALIAIASLVLTVFKIKI